MMDIRFVVRFRRLSSPSSWSKRPRMWKLQNVAHLSRNTSFASKFQFDIRAKNTLFILATVNCQGWLPITRAVHSVSFLQIGKLNEISCQVFFKFGVVLKKAKKPQCDNYVPQWWVELDDEFSWLFTNRLSVTR